MSDDHTVRAVVKIPTFDSGVRTPPIERAKAVLSDLRGRDPGVGKALAIGIACPGVIGEYSGVVRCAYNLGGKIIGIVAVLESVFTVPVVLRQDVRAAALVEHRIGVVTDACDCLFGALGMGIGLALALGGTMGAGAHDWVGEIGHLIVDPGAESCACGEQGCLETVAFARAIARRFGSERCDRSDVLDAEEVFAPGKDGDAKANEVLCEGAEALASSRRRSKNG